MPPDPAAELFTIDEVAKQLRIDKRTLKRLIDDGEFPRPLRPSPGVQVWSGGDLNFYRSWIALRSRLRTTRKKPPARGAKTPPAKDSA